MGDGMSEEGDGRIHVKSGYMMTMHDLRVYARC